MRTCFVAAGVLLAFISGARAGVISVQGISSDADSGISSSNSYTLALDPGDATGATVNGVAFAPMTATTGTSATATYNGNTYTYTISGGTLNNTSGNTGNFTASGNLQTMLSDFVYGGAASATGTLTLPATTLTAGQTYDARLYIRNWNNNTRTINVNFDEDGAGPLGASTGDFNADAPTSVPASIGGPFASNAQAYYIDYRYTAVAGQPLTMTVTMASGSDTFHFYGFTNQAVPEPATLGLVALAGGALLLRRRRGATTL